MGRLTTWVPGLTFVALVFGTNLAFAQDYPKGDVFGGFSILAIENGGDADVGFQASVAVNLNKRVGLVADFGRHTSSETILGFNVSGSLNQFLFGPRFNWRTPRLTSFVHGLIGPVRGSAAATALGLKVTDTFFAAAVGGGVDVKAGRNVAVRVIQADLFMGCPFDECQGDIRTGFGIVILFGQP